MSSEQLKLFNQKRLNIQVNNEFIGSFSKYGAFSGQSIKSWTPYQGFSKIKESIFFEIAGYPQEAAKARKYHNKTKHMYIWGGIGLFAGTILAVSPFFFQPSYGAPMSEWDQWERTSYALIIGGSIVMTGGAIPLVLAIFRRNWATIDQAVSVMEDYNIQLRNKLRSE